ncbi:MAG: hypothetical protein V3T86_03395 [Planctomycetota bacterium]
MSLDEHAPIRELLDTQVYEAEVEDFVRQGRTHVKTVHLNGFMLSLEQAIGKLVEERLLESLAQHKARLFAEVNDEVFAILEHAVRDAAYNALLVREREAEMEELRGSFREQFAQMRERVTNLFRNLSEDREQLESDPAALESELTSCLDELESKALAPAPDESDEGEPELGETFQSDAQHAIEDIFTD